MTTAKNKSANAAEPPNAPWFDDALRLYGGLDWSPGAAGDGEEQGPTPPLFTAHLFDENERDAAAEAGLDEWEKMSPNEQAYEQARLAWLQLEAQNDLYRQNQILIAAARRQAKLLARIANGLEADLVDIDEGDEELPPEPDGDREPAPPAGPKPPSVKPDEIIVPTKDGEVP
jgi:hypothetical protein